MYLADSSIDVANCSSWRRLSTGYKWTHALMTGPGRLSFFDDLSIDLKKTMYLVCAYLYCLSAKLQTEGVHDQSCQVRHRPSTFTARIIHDRSTHVSFCMIYLHSSLSVGPEVAIRIAFAWFVLVERPQTFANLGRLALTSPSYPLVDLTSTIRYPNFHCILWAVRQR